MSQSEDMDAIDAYFHNTEKKTASATTDFNSWISWFTNLGWYDKNFTDSVYNEARNRKHAFDLDNATSDEERAQVLEVQKTGLSTEQMQGNVDQRDISGNYYVPITQSFTDFMAKFGIKTWMLYAGAAFTALVGGATVIIAGKSAAETIAKKHL